MDKTDVLTPLGQGRVLWETALPACDPECALFPATGIVCALFPATGIVGDGIRESARIYRQY